MKISLLTDAPRHNLALMKISAWHKLNGDEVMLNMPIFSSDMRYASLLFDKNKKHFIADVYGGPAFEYSILPGEFENAKPDYSLFDLDYSVGYTFRPCFNTCSFCKVPKMNHPSITHNSIWDFHDSKLKKICLLNNNTFQDPKWKETFEEIWDADLTVIDENGYDVRLLDDEKANALKKTKFQGSIHFAFDRIQDEALVLSGLEVLKRHKIKARFYVLVGYNSNIDQDIYRCQKLIEHGFDPYIMPYIRNKSTKRFKRFIDSFMWRKYKTIKEAWQNYY